MWPLSVNEANLLNADIRNTGGSWWLRSPGYSDYDLGDFAASVHLWDFAASVIEEYIDAGGNYTTFTGGVHPAFNLNLSSIIFTSAAERGKLSGTGAEALTPIGEYTGNEWKVTLYDASRDTFSVSRIGSGGIVPGGVFRFSYENAKTKADTKEKEYISAILCDAGEPVYYGRIVDLTGDSATGSGEAYVKIPEGLTGENYAIYFFSEQYNGDKFTDIASDPNNAAFSFEIGKTTPEAGFFTITAPSDKDYDGTPSEPTVTVADGVKDLIDFEVMTVKAMS